MMICINRESKVDDETVTVMQEILTVLKEEEEEDTVTWSWHIPKTKTSDVVQYWQYGHRCSHRNRWCSGRRFSVVEKNVTWTPH